MATKHAPPSKKNHGAWHSRVHHINQMCAWHPKDAPRQPSVELGCHRCPTATSYELSTLRAHHGSHTWSLAPKGAPESKRMDSVYGKDTPFTDSTYMRELLCRRDSDYKSRLRLKERERMQAEQKREQRATQPLARPTIQAGRNYERPWINGMTSCRKMDIVDTEARDAPSSPRTLLPGRGCKLPSLYNIMGKKQKLPQLADVADNKGGVSSGPDHGTSFQAQRLQLKGKRGPAVSQQQLKGPGLGLVAGTAPGPPVMEGTQSGSLCCGVSAKAEEAREEAGAEAEGDDEPEPPASSNILASAPVPPHQPPSALTVGGKCQAQKEEGAGRREQGPGQPERQQTSLILRRLRQERLSTAGARRGEAEEAEDSEQPPVPPLLLSGTVDGLPTDNMAAAKMATDRLPFRLRVCQWAAAQEKGSGASSSRAAAEAPSDEEEDKGAEEEEEGRRANAPRALRPPQVEPAATANRGTQTLRGRCPPQTPQRPAPQPPVAAAPLLLPRLESGRLVSLLVTTTTAAAVASPAMVAAAAPPQQASTTGLTRLQPISATRLGAAAAGGGSSSWAQGRDPLPLSMAILALSELRAPESRAAAAAGEATKEERVNEKPRPDPETLKKLQESLLHEDSEEEEGDLCRICLIPGGTPLNPLLEPCKCVGSLQFVHHDCLKKWLQAKIISGADLTTVTTCELCKKTLKLDFDDFDVHEFHRKRAVSQVQ
ncbi:uncharacterized protein LOC144486055 [Mustelus asterias]